MSGTADTQGCATRMTDNLQLSVMFVVQDSNDVAGGGLHSVRHAQVILGAALADLAVVHVAGVFQLPALAAGAEEPWSSHRGRPG